MIGLNKWDLVADQPGLLKPLREDCTRLLPQVRGVAVVPLSGLAGDGLDKLMQAVVQAAEVWDTPHLDLADQRLAVRGDLTQPAAGRVGPAHQDPLRHAGEEPPAAFRPVRQPAQRPAEKLHALPGERPARGFDLPGTPIRLSLRTS